MLTQNVTNLFLPDDQNGNMLPQNDNMLPQNGNILPQNVNNLFLTDDQNRGVNH